MLAQECLLHGIRNPDEDKRQRIDYAPAELLGFGFVDRGLKTLEVFNMDLSIWNGEKILFRCCCSFC